ncbi:MAG: acetyl-CoA carboxylase biotin carboxylase subunit [Acidobacteria bacterium]|nr:acetyl-CoA carboxylase biotin carboxylase subunit [Acidobacteriota bacterium]
MFKKILIANRGEIAVRVIRAAKEMGIATVAVYSECDRAALHVRLADEAHLLGPSPSAESYLNIDRVIEAALSSRAEAIHPGYGFLSENPEFARRCAKAGVAFIGPAAAAMEQVGGKIVARETALEANVPVVPGTRDGVRNVSEALKAAGEVGFPVLIKAAAGGGGKGMRLVERPEQLASALRDAQSEAAASFGDSAVYLEKFIIHPRHIEFQILADRHGNVIHLGERECSIQRRHQKVIEECPSPLMTAELREAMGAAAVSIARACQYENAGTVEFLVDAQRNFYFLEMNTRLQVEHPITEWVTGVDLVKEQFRIAAGEKLGLRQQDVAWRGAALECRIYAEDPGNNFFPSPGQITLLRTPSGPGVRDDTGIYEGWTVPVFYDPLLSKLVTFGRDRSEAISRMQRALEEYQVAGIKTNLSFFRSILSHERFLAGELSTDFIQRYYAPAATTTQSAMLRDVALVAAALHASREGKAPSRGKHVESAWKQAGRVESLRQS